MNEEERIRIILRFSSYCACSEEQLIIEYYQTGRRTIELRSQPRLYQRTIKLIEQYPDRNENDWVLFFIQNYREDSNNGLAKEHLICYLESVLNDVVHERNEVAYERRNTPICERIYDNYQSYPELNMHMSDLIQMGREEICDLDSFVDPYQSHLSTFQYYAKNNLRRRLLDKIFYGRLSILLRTQWRLLTSQSDGNITRALSPILRPEEVQDYLHIRRVFVEYYIYPDGSNPLPKPTNEQLQTMAEVYSVTSLNEVTGEWIREKLQIIARALRNYLTMPTSSLNAPIGEDSDNSLEIIDFIESDDTCIPEDIIPKFRIQELLEQMPTFLIELYSIDIRRVAVALLKSGLNCKFNSGDYGNELNTILQITTSHYAYNQQLIPSISSFSENYLTNNCNFSEEQTDINEVRRLLRQLSEYLLNEHYREWLDSFFNKVSCTLLKHQTENQDIIDNFLRYFQQIFLLPLQIELSQSGRSIIEMRLLEKIEKWRNSY